MAARSWLWRAPRIRSTRCAPGETVAGILPSVLASGPGDVLCFLPGAGEIERALQDARAVAERHDVDLLPLHGSLAADAQDRALVPGPRRRVVMATNIAETSLTVPGVSNVVDGGWQKVARYDAERAIDTLVRRARDGRQRGAASGRAARLGPGRAWQLWDARDRLRPAREPEVAPRGPGRRGARPDGGGHTHRIASGGSRRRRRTACRPRSTCWTRLGADGRHVR